MTTDIGEYYARAGAMTDAGRHRTLVDQLPGDVASLARVVQGLVIHEYMAAAYGVTVPNERRWESHLRPAERLFDRVLELDGGPLSEPRPPETRLIGVCHHHVVLLVGMLRARGVPARARAGFGSYFNPPYFEDHWVCEYWNAGQQRWVLADPQFDDVWRRDPKIDHVRASASKATAAFGCLPSCSTRFYSARRSWA